MFCKPVRQVDIEICAVGIGISLRKHCNRANSFEHKKDQCFNPDQTKADPHPGIDLICYNGIQQVKNHKIKKYPNSRVEQLNPNKFS